MNGRITPKGKINGTIGTAITKPLPYYEGAYEVEPIWENIVLDTKQKSMHEDVTITEIPYLEADNPQGGITVIIGGR